MSDIWYRHNETGGEYLGPESARAQLAASGWEPFTKKDTAAKEAEQADQVAAAEREMRAKAAEAGVTDPDAPDDQGAAPADSDTSSDAAASKK